jgi:hypothetical protein
MNNPRSDESTEPAEVYEHIPWAQLATPTQEKKSLLIYLIAGAIVAASLGALVARSMGRSPESPAVAVTTPITAPSIVELPPPSPSPGEDPLSEADLLAVVPGQYEVEAAARAEWFVTDYFSSGGDPAASRAVVEALPENSRLPVTTSPESTSYVDWVSTSRTEAVGNDRFRSTVLFRVLVSADNGTYVRLPVQAVDVVVEVDPAGGTRVVDLPMPVVIPPGPLLQAWGDPSAEVPDLIRTSALRLTEGWGTEPAFIEAGQRGGGWRVVVSVVDEAGVRWPLSLWLTDEGKPAPGG